MFEELAQRLEQQERPQIREERPQIRDIWFNQT
jgi:hypothetical protein